MKIQLIRTRFGEKSTHGVLFIDGKFFGYTLEDIVRLPFVKVKEKTAIKAGDYFVNFQYSKHFSKEKLFLQNVSDFQGIMIHEGHDADDSSGCILLAKGICSTGLKDSMLAVNELQQLSKIAIAKGEKITIHICNSIWEVYDMCEHAGINFNELIEKCW